MRAQFETNVFGLVRLTQLALPGMRAQGWGRVVNVSSMGGRFTFPGGGFYHASKHAVEAVSDALRYEVAPFGVGGRARRAGPGQYSAFGDTAVATIDAAPGRARTTATTPTPVSAGRWPRAMRRRTTAAG